MNERKVAGATRCLIIATGLKFECARVLHEILFMLVLRHGSETMKWK